MRYLTKARKSYSMSCPRLIWVIGWKNIGSSSWRGSSQLRFMAMMRQIHGIKSTQLLMDSTTIGPERLQLRSAKFMMKAWSHSNHERPRQVVCPSFPSSYASQKQLEPNLRFQHARRLVSVLSMALSTDPQNVNWCTVIVIFRCFAYSWNPERKRCNEEDALVGYPWKYCWMYVTFDW